MFTNRKSSISEARAFEINAEDFTFCVVKLIKTSNLYQSNNMTEDQLFQECLDQAKLALEEKEVAIGCVFYHSGLRKIIARGRNSVNATKNATRHAELNCIDDVLELCSTDKSLDMRDIWPEIEVYVTCEPCIMCARILRHLRVKIVVYGCSNERFGGCRSVINVANNPMIGCDPLIFKHGVREEEAIDLLKTFYSGENLNAPEEIRKVKRQRVDVDS